MPVGQIVKAWREAKGLTITQLAARAGRPITKGYLSQLEKGAIREPREGKLAQLAEALGIPVLHLVTGRFPDLPSTPTPAPRRRLGTALGGPPIGGTARPEPPRPTVGNQVDRVVSEAGLSLGEQEVLRGVLLPHVKHLTFLIKLARGGRDETTED